MAISKLILNGEVQMDVTSNTNTAANMLSGVVGTKNDGTSVTGNIATKTSSDLTASGATVTAPAGYYANAASKAVATTTHPNPSASITSSTGVVTASHTQSTGYVTGGTTTGTLNLTTQAGKTVTPTESAQTAVASYRWTTGNVNVAAISSTYVGTGVAQKSSADLTANGSTVTAPAGYYSTAATKSIGAGSAFPPAVTITKAPTIGVNASGVVTASYTGSSSITPTVTSGYVSKGTAGTISTTGTSTYQLTSKAAATYYPSTADQTIASQRWLVGNQTIKSVTTSNLTAANIAKGVVVKVGDANNASRITQLTGTHIGGVDVPIFTQTWDSNWTAPIGSVTCNKTYAECYANLNNDIMECAGVFTTTNGISNYYITGLGGYIAYEGDSAHLVYVGINDGMPLYQCSYYSNGTITYSQYTSNLQELYVTSNGDYGQQRTVWNHVVVSVPTGYTIDQIAMRTISGVISGTTSQIKTGAFGYCSNITEIDFPNVTLINTEAFQACYQLSSISLPQLTSAYKSAFAYCSSLTTVNLPLLKAISDNLFYFCKNLTTVSCASASRIWSQAFYCCSKLTTISFPSVNYIAEGAFSECRGLVSIDFPQVISVASNAFFGCFNLTTANFPLAQSFYSSVFGGCSGLTSISCPSLKTIGMSAFANCFALSTISLPNISSIDRYAFNLLSLYLLGSSIPTLGDYYSPFSSTPISSYTTSTGGVYGKIYVPASLYNSYLTATNWATYSSRFVSG